MQGIQSAVLDFALSASYNHAWLALACVLSLLVIGALVFVPRQPVCLVAGFLFGVSSFPLALLATTVGSVVAFLLARYVWNAWFRGLVEARKFGAVTMKAVNAEGWKLMFMLRLASPVPGALTNFLFGLTDMTLAGYTLVTLLGLAPQTLLFVYLGAVGGAAMQTASISTAKSAFTIIGIISFALCTSMVAKRVRTILASYDVEHPKAVPPA